MTTPKSTSTLYTMSFALDTSIVFVVDESIEFTIILHFAGNIYSLY